MPGITKEHQQSHFSCCHTVQAQEAAPCCLFLTQMYCFTLCSVLAGWWMKCQRMSWMSVIILGYFQPLSGLTVSFLPPPSLHQDTCGFALWCLFSVLKNNNNKTQKKPSPLGFTSLSISVHRPSSPLTHYTGALHTWPNDHIIDSLLSTH